MSMCASAGAARGKRVTVRDPLNPRLRAVPVKDALTNYQTTNAPHKGAQARFNGLTRQPSLRLDFSHPHRRGRQETRGCRKRRLPTSFIRSRFKRRAEDCLKIVRLRMCDLEVCRVRVGGYNRRLKRGLFITFEGIDGSGKTTQLRRLGSFLAAKGLAVTVAQEPGGTRVGREIRRLLLDAANEDLRPVPELLLYFASRAQNIEEVIEPALREGRIVVADRFTDATVAYQGYGRELGIEAVRKTESVACQGVQPDLTLLLDIDIETGVGRALDRNADQTADESRMEQESRAFYERVAEGYAALLAAEPERIKKIDGRGSIDEVTGAIEAEVERFLTKRSKKDPA